MAIDIQSLFNPGSLQDIAETDEQRRKRAQLTGTMNLGGQTGTFTGNFDPSVLQQQPGGLPPVAYQLPPQQQSVPQMSAPAPVPPVGTSPMTGQYTAPPQPPVPLPVSNQPYQMPPPVSGFDQTIAQPPNPFANEPGRDNNGVLIPGYGQLPPETFLGQPVDTPRIYGDMTPGQALGGEFTMPQPVTPIAPDQQPSLANPLSQIPIGQEYNTVLAPMPYGTNPFANEPGRDSNGELIPGYGDPGPGVFMDMPRYWTPN